NPIRAVSPNRQRNRFSQSLHIVKLTDFNNPHGESSSIFLLHLAKSISILLCRWLSSIISGWANMLLTLGIFLLAYVFIATEKFPRHWVALIGGGLLIALGLLSPAEALTYINWETLGLLSGMFILVSILHEAGFFKWLAMRAVRKVNYHPTYLFIALLILAGGLAMWMDSITVMLFLSALTLQLCY